jgi:putative FmdB family regulatory protein
MPIYEYHCSKCGDFEIMQKISDKPLTNCPTCRRKVSKLISSTSFQLKGSGWYITDYARKSEGGGKKGDDKKSETTTETKSDTSSTSGDSGGGGAGSKKSDKTTKKSEKAAAA